MDAPVEPMDAQAEPMDVFNNEPNQEEMDHDVSDHSETSENSFSEVRLIHGLKNILIFHSRSKKRDTADKKLLDAPKLTMSM